MTAERQARGQRRFEDLDRRRRVGQYLAFALGYDVSWTERRSEATRPPFAAPRLRRAARTMETGHGDYPETAPDHPLPLLPGCAGRARLSVPRLRLQGRD